MRQNHLNFYLHILIAKVLQTVQICSMEKLYSDVRHGLDPVLVQNDIILYPRRVNALRKVLEEKEEKNNILWLSRAVLHLYLW